MQPSTNYDYPEINFNCLQHAMMQVGDEKEVSKLFKDPTFRANPYETLVKSIAEMSFCDIHRQYRPIIYTPIYHHLPNIRSHLTLKLLQDVAVKHWKDNPEKEKIMAIFNRSLASENFLKHFDYALERGDYRKVEESVNGLFVQSRAQKAFKYEKPDYGNLQEE
ncbi:MAG: hypothetical protein VX777_06775 [Chlamydiota bacterium]|nr:hypothetical protein [Chlamydiota bacterium]